MDQINQTNNLQQAINEVANGADNKDQFGIPPMPPMEGEGVPSSTPFTTEPVEPAAPSAEQILSNDMPNANIPVDTPEIPAMPEPVTVPAENDANANVNTDGELASIRENVIKDLLPLMDKVNSTPEEKFDIYKDAMKTMHDAKTIEGAYRTATQIADETKKADALIGLMKTIDNA